MPHPKHMQKQSGDVHPPELDDGSDAPLEQVAMDARADAGGATFRAGGNAPAAPRFADFEGSLQGYGDAARRQVRARPMASMGAAFALGFVLASIF